MNKNLIFFGIFIIIYLLLYLLVKYIQKRGVKVENFELDIARNHFRLYQFIPSTNRMLFSFKPLKIEYWFTQELIDKFYKKNN